jgi:hypothetical protein
MPSNFRNHAKQFPKSCQAISETMPSNFLKKGKGKYLVNGFYIYFAPKSVFTTFAKVSTYSFHCFYFKSSLMLNFNIMKQPFALIAVFFCLVSNLMAQNTAELITIFDYPHFKNTQGLKLIQDAYVLENKIRLTQAVESQKGGMWYTQDPLQVDKGFTTVFNFQISSSGGYGEGADGIALIIHNAPQNLEQGIHGGGMGYEGIPNCIAIEFDTFDNEEYEDRSNNHISVQTKGQEPNKPTLDASVAINRSLGFDLKDGKAHQAKITYQTGKLNVYVDDMKMPILTAHIDIAKTINLDNGKAWVGISSATGAGYANHDILSWSMKTTQPTQKEIDKPEVFEKRKVDYIKVIKVSSPDIVIQVWDHKEEDGDIISLNLNGKWVTENHLLKKAAKAFKVKLHPKENFLILHALNLGSIPPNTASFAIIEGKQKQTFILRSDLQQSQALSIVYEPH